MLRIRLLLVSVLWCLVLPVFANVNVGRYDTVHIVPAPGKVVIDGDLGEWDRSGEFFTYRFEEQKAKYYLKGYMMYDAENLYLAAHIGDSSPMMNLYNPDAEAAVAWRGDCLQVRFSADRALGWPIRDGRTTSDQLAHLTMWYYTPKALPCIMLQYGMDYHGLRLNPPGVHGAYRKDDDGKGYVLEYAIPWTLLNCGDNPPKAGDVTACIWQMLWSDEQGRKYQADLSEIRNPSDPSLAYQSAGGWGRAIFEKTGNLPAGTVVARDEAHPAPPSTGFLPIDYTVPGKTEQHVSMQLLDCAGHTVRWLLGDAPRAPGQHTELWNGLDDDNNPVPTGTYTVSWCRHNVSATLLATANNPGTPPYNTSDNRGSWAGDYGWPTAVTATTTHVFLAHLAGEASRALIKLTPDGQRVWGVDPTQDLSPHIIDMCTDNAALYILYGDYDGGKVQTGGFVKLNADTGYNEAVGTTGRSYVVLTDPAHHDGMGVDGDMAAIAVDKATVYVASSGAGKIFCIDKATGKQTRVIDGLVKPHGLAIGPDGRLYVIADRDVLVMQTDGSNRGILVHWWDIAAPKRLTVAKNGDLYVTVQGVYQQLFHYDAQGKLLGTIGKEGGLSVPGPWVADAMLRPSSVCVAPDGKLWVTEERMNPKRTSVWNPDGTLAADYTGPVPYASTCAMDPADPVHLYSENTQFTIDYLTGRTKPTAVVCDDGERGQIGPISGAWSGHFIHFQGRTFLAQGEGNLYEVKDGRFVLRVQTVFTPGITRNPYWTNTLHLGLDRNGDGKIDAGEMQTYPLLGGAGWLAWIADNLDIYCGDWTGIWKMPFEGFDVAGVPIYHTSHMRLLFTTDKARLAAGEGRPFPVPGVPDRWWLDSAGNMYLLMSAGENRIKRGQPYLDKGHRLVKLSPNLHVLWEYRNLVVGMGACWNTTIAKPGEILGTQRFTGDFGRYLTVSSYYGQYHILDKETGLYITAITPDTRSEPPLDGMAVFTENFNGWAVYAPSMKKYLFCGGDAQARVWEVHGLEDVKYARTAVTVTDADHAKAVAASKTIYGLTGVEQGEKVLMTPQLGVRVDGDLSEWAGANWAPFAVDDHRKGRAALAWTSTGLSVAFDMTDDSPLRNRGGNLNLLFKSGDALEFDISSAAADVARPDEKPVTGDKRILLSVVKDANGTERAVAMLYEPKSARADKSPGTFTSPVSTVTYDYVGQLPAQIAWQRTDTGYTLEAAFDAQALGFTGLEVGQRLRVDFGALFSDKGGAMTLAKTLWADDSPEVSIVNDIPTEAKIHPKRWGWAVLR